MRGEIILLLVFLLIISSCETTQQTTNLGGIDMEFLPAQPPTDVFREDSEFRVGLKLKNNLPDLVENVKLCVYDLLGDDYGGIDKECQVFSLAAAQIEDDRIFPEEKLVYFPEFGTYSYTNLEFAPDNTIIIVDMTYPLQTRSSLNICLKKDPAYEVKEVPCETNTIFTSGDIRSDYAPISVDKVESSLTLEGENNGIYLDIHLRKATGGEIVVSDDDLRNLMEIEVNLGSDVQFDCETDEDGLIKFEENTKEVSCSAVVNLDDAYEVNSLNIVLSYNYRVKLQTGQVPFRKKNKEVV